jgi:hypothetical protein
MFLRRRSVSSVGVLQHGTDEAVWIVGKGTAHTSVSEAMTLEDAFRALPPREKVAIAQGLQCERRG